MINVAKGRARKVHASTDQGEAQGLKLGTSWSFVSCEGILHIRPRPQGPRKCGPRAKTRTEEIGQHPYV